MEAGAAVAERSFSLESLPSNLLHADCCLDFVVLRPRFRSSAVRNQLLSRHMTHSLTAFSSLVAEILVSLFQRATLWHAVPPSLDAILLKSDVSSMAAPGAPADGGKLDHFVALARRHDPTGKFVRATAVLFATQR